MFYPEHYIRTYCIYLGSLEHRNCKYDMGVYIHPDKSVSHAIVWGQEESEYISGCFIFKGNLEAEEFRMSGILCKINELLYQDYIVNQSRYPQPDIFKPRT